MNGGNGTRTLVRSRKGRMLAGICAGAAEYFGVASIAENVVGKKQAASAGR